jgi:4-amino-4-deoxy-L-arabinose transferase-like glycosyltransferase
VLLLVAFAACLPQALLPDWTGTEGRRVQVALEILRSGDWFVPTLGGEPAWAKPPLHYWILAASAWAFGDGWLALRLPSILALWALALLAYALHRRPFGAAAAWIVALGVICAPVVLFSFPSAEIDPIFASLTAASLWCLAFGVARQGRGMLVASGVLGGLALLQKGPPYLMFAAGAWLVWWRHRGCRGFLAYGAPLLLVPALYYVPLLMLRASAGDLGGVAGDETIGRLFTYEWRHLIETPAYLLRAVAVQLPLVAWCFWEFRSTRDARMGPADLTLRMCSGAAVFAVLVLTLFPARPTRYLLPNVPLFTFAVAPAVAHYALHRSGLGGFARGALRAIGAAGALLLVAAPVLPAPFPGRAPVLGLCMALVPLLVRRPRGLVAACLWLPVLGAWTLLADRAGYLPASERGNAAFGPVLRREIDARSAHDLQTFGHFNSGLLLGAGLLPRGCEAAERPPDARFVLYEAEGLHAEADLSAYADRVRLCLPGETYVLAERR